MSGGFFSTDDPVPFEGPDSTNPLAFRYYQPDLNVLGKRMEDHLRFAVCYWHSFCWPGGDPFGGDTFERPWFQGDDPMALARAKADVAFDLYRLLDVPFFTFHDRDIAPEGSTLAESNANVLAIADLFQEKMQTAKVRLLWGTANMFSNRRFMAGAASNPDPDVFTYAAAQVKNCIEVTHDLGGVNYVMWGAREGYETLLNTDLKREQDQLGRFMKLVVEHKHKIGFPGTLLIE
ncbi:MAG: xylose isomerase, partial [Geminicoccaceae bacterium]